ncbi:MAG: hypothetical protein FE047_02205 [Thermoplasmata archaeon]|nr:MAG: hypothetical protein FE047_02205 [Thermoplasmata archaeon]KAA0012361.1 MAG: hypothetical protein FE041_03605 [Thermoplasmata archaeon]
MKSRFLCISIVLLFLFVNIPSHAENEIILEYKFSKPTLEKIGNKWKVEIDGCQLHEHNGLIVPVKPLYILLPPYREVDKIEVKGKEKYIGFYPIEEAKPIIAGNKIIKISPKKETNVLYEKVGVYKARGFPILVMNLFPISYKNGKLYYYKTMEVKIKLKKAEISHLYRGLEIDKKWIKELVDNPWIVDKYPAKKIDEKYDYLIITNNKLKGAFKEFIDYKESKGIKVKLATVEEIIDNSSFWGEGIFNDTQAKIRNFIRYAYLNWGIEYVLLGGDGDVVKPDENIIPPRYLYATCVGLPLTQQDVLEAYIPSDVYYACLDGNFNEDEDEKWGENATENEVSDEDEADLFAEVYVGRACVDSPAEVENITRKSMSYEMSNNESLLQILLLGEYLGFGGPAEWGGNHKDEVKPLIPSYFNITTLYDRDNPWSKDTLIFVLNKGFNIVNHDGHGWTTYALKMRNPDLKKLRNNDYFFLYSQTCLAGSFDNWYPEDNYYEDDCFAEHLTCNEHGAFACIMNSRYGLGMENSTDSPGQRYDLAFFKAIFEENIKEIGKANHYSKEINVWRINENGMRWIYYETNLFGDPQIAIREPMEKVNISLEVIKPLKGIYIFDRGPLFSFINKTIVFGGITIEANVSTDPPGKIERVNFYVNDELKATLFSAPFVWEWNEHAIGNYKISVEAYATNGKAEKKEVNLFIVNL